MILYFVKTILCSALLLLAYKLLFENEKMPRFNRVYLLCSIAFSFIVPLITVQTHSPILPPAEIPTLNTMVFSTYQDTPTFTPVTENNTLSIMLWSIYVTITTLLLFRFGNTLKTLFSRIWNSPVIPFKNATLVLISDDLIPHSFLNYIFLNGEAYSHGRIEQEILLHELTHVQQKHSLDILFIELVQAIVWFNPVFILYRKAIQLNHEFLADDSVIATYGNTLRYQHLLIDKASQKNSLLLTNPFNYSITKKRLLMMTRSTSLGRALCRQIAVVPLVAIAVFLFTAQINAQDSTKIAQDSTKIKTPQTKPKETKPSPWVGQYAGSTKEGVSQELLREYEAIINKYKMTDKKWPVNIHNKISETDFNRLETIFKQMNKEQQSKQVVAFIKPAPPLPRIVPTKAQVDSWKNLNMYGLWIDEKKEKNTVLNNYINTDFAQVFVSKLYGAAKKNVSYSYQVDLMTKEYYQKYYDQTMANKQNRMVVRRFTEETK